MKVVDTRYYHEFDASFIWRDHEVREATISELRQVNSLAIAALLLRQLTGIEEWCMLKLLYPSILQTSEQEAHPRQLDFSADAVYQVLRPSSSVTEKIALQS